MSLRRHPTGLLTLLSALALLALPLPEVARAGEAHYLLVFASQWGSNNSIIPRENQGKPPNAALIPAHLPPARLILTWHASSPPGPTYRRTSAPQSWR